MNGVSVFVAMKDVRGSDIMRDKKRNPLCLKGRSVILKEIQPIYFPYVIEWRNNKNLNRYLNHPEDLTIESETQWYEKKYLNDENQGFMIMIEKETNMPFGTRGWTDMDAVNKCCIMGRLILGNSGFNGSIPFLESHFLLCDYIYKFVDVSFIHVGVENKRALRLNKFLGYVPNKGIIKYPAELSVNGDEKRKQIELYRTKEMYTAVKEKVLRDALFANQKL